MNAALIAKIDALEAQEFGEQRSLATPAVTFSHALRTWLVRAVDGWWKPCDPQTARDAVDCGYRVLER